MRLTMQRLELDFYRAGPVSSWAGWALLATAIAFAGNAALAYHQADSAVARNEARLSSLEAPQAMQRGAKAGAKVNPEEVAAARETIQRMSIPWTDLFAALESTASAEVSLLSIDPDPKSGRVLISGESRDLAAVLDYVARLGRTQVLTGVHLVKHEIRKEGSRAPAAFSVAASWREGKR